MDIKWKNCSHSLATKIIVFIFVIISFTGSILSFLYMADVSKGNFDIIYEENYYKSREFALEVNEVIDILRELIFEYKGNDNILQGNTIEREFSSQEEELYEGFKNSPYYDYELSEIENFAKFKEVYGEKLDKIRNELIEEDLREYNYLLGKLRKYKGLAYYCSDGENVITNQSRVTKSRFMEFPFYLVADNTEEIVFPREVKEGEYYYRIQDNINTLSYNNADIYIAFDQEYMKEKMENWKRNRSAIMESMYIFIGFLLALMVSFIYLVIITGRKSFGDKEISFNYIDRLYTDINIILCILIIFLYLDTLTFRIYRNLNGTFLLPLSVKTAVMGSLGLILVLSLVKHIKNKTLIKHTLIYKVLYRVFCFIREIFDNGSLAVKTVLIIILYPIVTVASLFLAPIIIGLAAWISLKKVKEYNAIKEGIERIKNGDVQHKISVNSKGELGYLASSINTISDGLKKALENELKSERLKTELITNVSHDIRTPLTSIITYVDLLKQEKDEKKSGEYIRIIDQKSQRLKTLIDDLFDAAKASSGNIPVNLEKLDVVSLITQGLGELDDKIKEAGLDFKLNLPKEKVFIIGDGKLLWRAIENLLSNILKYSLKGSRVYIDVKELEREVVITFKNISAYQLNISADELMERFKRGDESRSSEGSGLGLSIAQSLIEIQRGTFKIEIDGDLFKAIIHMPKE